MSETKSNLWSLKFHEELFVHAGLTVQRVPGGWNYMYSKPAQLMRSDGWVHNGDWEIVQVVFVPYTTEFKEDVVLEQV